MKNLLGLIVLSILFLSCDLNKYTTVRIDNQNSFPIEVSIKTNNIETIYLIDPNSKIDTLRKFTDIAIEDGQWDVTLKNAATNQVIKQHNHGQYYNGDLANFFSFETKGSYLKFSVDN